jgi:hypothetical protein
MNTESTELHTRVLRVISDRTIENPITARAIGELINADVRTIAQCVEELRFMSFKIGSSKKSPMGYFLARNPEELKETSERMKQTCLVQLAQLKRMNTWNSIQPTIWEGDALYHIQRIIADANTINNDQLSVNS